MVQDGTHQRATPDKMLTNGNGDGYLEEKRKKVGNYIILKTIGEGSFAKVRLGYHLITEVKVNQTIPVRFRCLYHMVSALFSILTFRLQ